MLDWEITKGKAETRIGLFIARCENKEQQQRLLVFFIENYKQRLGIIENFKKQNKFAQRVIKISLFLNTFDLFATNSQNKDSCCVFESAQKRKNTWLINVYNKIKQYFY
jgi:hypothetical protein